RQVVHCFNETPILQSSLENTGRYHDTTADVENADNRTAAGQGRHGCCCWCRAWYNHLTGGQLYPGRDLNVGILRPLFRTTFHIRGMRYTMAYIHSSSDGEHSRRDCKEEAATALRLPHSCQRLFVLHSREELVCRNVASFEDSSILHSWCIGILRSHFFCRGHDQLPIGILTSCR
ncbi:hypothetical protein FOZ63_013201, partial [Perkinsus olseni]